MVVWSRKPSVSQSAINCINPHFEVALNILSSPPYQRGIILEFTKSGIALLAKQRPDTPSLVTVIYSKPPVRCFRSVTDSTLVILRYAHLLILSDCHTVAFLKVVLEGSPRVGKSSCCPIVIAVEIVLTSATAAFSPSLACIRSEWKVLNVSLDATPPTRG